jgi:hypothetical protein
MQTDGCDSSICEDVPVRAADQRLVHVDLIATPLRWPAMFVAMVVGLTFGAIMISGRPVVAYVVLAIAIPALFFLMFFIRRRIQRQVERIVKQEPTASLPALVASVFRGRRKAGTLGMQRAARLARVLAANDRFGETLRLCPTKSATPLQPFDIVFDPQSLDQTGETFRQLESTGGDLPDGTAIAAAEAFADDSMWLKIKRNVVLRGGWIIAGVFLINVLIYAWRSIAEGRVQPNLILWIAFLSLTLFGASGAAQSRKQWFVVPGGLIVRKTGRLDRNWKVHLLEPAKSVLMVFQAGRHQWIACAADENFTDRVVVTKREADFLLRAWLSPLSPPAVEKLTDLV